MSDNYIDPKKLTHLKQSRPGFADAADYLEDLERKRDEGPEGSVISQRVRIEGRRIEEAINFWKPIYLSYTVEGRLLNGIEAYDLGDQGLQGDKADPACYIAMCNLMALEAILMMGDSWPTVEDAQYLASGSERERHVADFWKKTFAPTVFQARWAWTAAMAVMAGEPNATRELLYQYREQLP